MRTKPVAVLVVLLIASVAGGAAAGEPKTALTGVNVVDVERGTVQRGVTILVDGNRIADVGRPDVPEGANVIDASGKYVIPGLWDMHVHLVHGDWNVADLLVAHGVTSVRDMWGSPSLAAELSAARADHRWPRIVMGGNLVDGTRVFAPKATLAETPEEGRAVVDALAAAGAPFVKVYDSLAPDVYDAILARAAERGLPVVGHVPMQVGAGHAADAGQRSIEHAFGVLPSCSTEEESLHAGGAEMLKLLAAQDMPGALATWMGGLRRMLATQDDARCRALARRLASKGTWVVPTLVALRGNWMRTDEEFRSDPRLRWIPPDLRTSWLPENGVPSRFFKPEDWQAGQAMYRRAIEVVGLLNQASVPLLAGSDAVQPYVFPGSGLHDELELLVEAGLSPAQAIAAATTSPARFMERSADLGAVAPGKLADLVVLDASPLDDIGNVRRIHGVILDGAWLSRRDLDAILTATERRFAAPASPPAVHPGVRGPRGRTPRSAPRTLP